MDVLILSSSQTYFPPISTDKKSNLQVKLAFQVYIYTLTIYI